MVKAAAEANMAEVRRSFMVSCGFALWLRLRHSAERADIPRGGADSQAKPGSLASSPLVQ